MKQIKTIIAISIILVSCTDKSKSQLAKIECIDKKDSTEYSSYYYIDVLDYELQEIYWINGEHNNKVLSFYHTISGLPKADNRVPMDADSNFYFTTNNELNCSCKILTNKEVQAIKELACKKCKKLSNSNQQYCFVCIKAESNKCVECKNPILDADPYSLCYNCYFYNNLTPN